MFIITDKKPFEIKGYTLSIDALDLPELQSLYQFAESEKMPLDSVSDLYKVLNLAVVYEVVTLKTASAIHSSFKKYPAFYGEAYRPGKPFSENQTINIPDPSQRRVWLLYFLNNCMVLENTENDPFFFIEVHNLFKGASREFTVDFLKLIRAVKKKGIEVIFKGKTPKIIKDFYIRH